MRLTNTLRAGNFGTFTPLRQERGKGRNGHPVNLPYLTLLPL
jgi:hypothetical protein